MKRWTPEEVEFLMHEFSSAEMKLMQNTLGRSELSIRTKAEKLGLIRDGGNAPDIEGERWLPIIGFEGMYEVSSVGRIRGLSRLSRNGKRVPPKILTNARKVTSGKNRAFGYMRIKLSKDGRLHDLAVHLLVLEAFVGPRPDGMDGCHGDGDTSNNTLPNLRWDTPKGNMADKILHGTIAKGERNGFSKLTENDVHFIRGSDLSQKMLSEKLGVSKGCIARVRAGQTWKHVVGGDHASK